MTDEAILRFSEEVQHEIEAAITDEAPFSEEVFTKYLLERLEDAGHFENTFDLYQEGRIRNATYRIDGYAFDEERSRLDLFTTIYSTELPPAKLATPDVTKTFERAIRFASACVDGLASQLEPSNTDASDLARLIETQASDLTAVRIVLLTNGIIGNVKTSTQWRDHTVEFEVYDIVRLQRILGEGETRADISVDLEELTGKPVPCLHVEGGKEYEAYLAVFPGDVLSTIYERYGSRLLELNVRAFLGLRGRKSVNAELRKTIVEQPAMFLAFNNGIVATVDDLELVSDETSGAVAIRKLNGLQIVNGGQTTASLHRARRKESILLDGVSVPVKIIKVGGADLSEMVSSISRAANRQNNIQLADFSANDPFHQELETLANNTWLEDGRGRWFYERARGSYLAAEQKASYRKTDQKIFRTQTPKQRRFNKLDVARYLTAWDSLPHRVCLGGQKNFQHFMQAMKDNPPPAIDAEWFKRLIALAVLYRAVEKKIRSMKLPAYRSQVAAYLVAGLSYRTGGRIDFKRIWSQQAISLQLEQLIEQWTPVMDASMRKSAGQRNPSEWYKKEDCWKEIQQQLPALTEPLPPELSYAGEGGAQSLAPVGTHSAADYDRIEQVMRLDGATLLAVAEKGQQAGLIHYKVAGICRTLAGYAAGGWLRKPSAKQAKPALDALKTVGDAGLVSVEFEQSTEQG
jgi:hypothetical protein